MCTALLAANTHTLLVLSCNCEHSPTALDNRKDTTPPKQTRHAYVCGKFACSPTEYGGRPASSRCALNYDNILCCCYRVALRSSLTESIIVVVHYIECITEPHLTRVHIFGHYSHSYIFINYVGRGREPNVCHVELLPATEMHRTHNESLMNWSARGGGALAFGVITVIIHRR